MAGLEIHAWFSRVSPEPDARGRSTKFTGSEAALERSILNYPDFIVFDLDPYLYSGREGRGEEPELHRRAFARTRRLALRIREILEGLGLATFIKTSGRTGLHLYLPIVRDLDFDAARAVAETIARHVQRERPKDVTVEWAVRRRTGKIFFDYNQNSRGKSLAVPYSPRRHPAAHGLDAARLGRARAVYPTDFTLHTVPDRLEADGDAWAGILEARQDLAASSVGRGDGAMSGRLDALSKTAHARLRYRPQPGWMAPMLATLVEAPPRGGTGCTSPSSMASGRWCTPTAARPALLPEPEAARGAYPELVEALGLAVRGDAVLDGEVVAVDPATGQSSFSRLQRRMQLRDEVRARASGVAVELYLFDCLFYEGIDLTGLPLVDRKAVLRDVVWYDGPIRFTPFRTTGSAAMFREACAKGAEGIIAKRAESRYASARSLDWLKIKCVHQQEFVVGGYTAPKGSRERLGALLVGYYENGALRYAGKVGTGYDRAALELLHRRLGPLHRRTSPFAPGPAPAADVQWVTPRLVVEIGFGEWTPAGLLRHPRYLGVREDKTAAEVRKEG